MDKDAAHEPNKAQQNPIHKRRHLSSNFCCRNEMFTIPGDFPNCPKSWNRTGRGESYLGAIIVILLLLSLSQ